MLVSACSAVTESIVARSDGAAEVWPWRATWTNSTARMDRPKREMC